MRIIEEKAVWLLVITARYIPVMVMIAAGHLCVAQSCDSLMGAYINQDSSIVHIKVDDGGFLKGSYQSNASDDTILYPLYGVVNRHSDLTTLSFHVSWDAFGSITSWTGYCEDDENEIKLTLMWHLVRPYVKYDWERMVTNKSVFTPFIK